MSRTTIPQSQSVFAKIRLMANGNRFRILELTQTTDMSISELSKSLRLSYTKCADYVTLLESQGLVQKTPEGREVHVKSKVHISRNTVTFL